MDLFSKLLVGLILLFSATVIEAAANVNALANPIGFWKTLDDVTGQPNTIVQIWETHNHVLMGKIVKTYSKRNQSLVALVILNGLKLTETQQWKGGNILDPENGKTFHCSIRIDGQKLLVQAYTGMPLLGRSQLWERGP